MASLWWRDIHPHFFRKKKYNFSFKYCCSYNLRICERFLLKLFLMNKNHKIKDKLVGCGGISYFPTPTHHNLEDKSRIIKGSKSPLQNIFEVNLGYIRYRFQTNKQITNRINQYKHWSHGNKISPNLNVLENVDMFEVSGYWSYTVTSIYAFKYSAISHFGFVLF